VSELFYAHNGSGDMLIQPSKTVGVALTIYAGNGCEDGAYDMTLDDINRLRDTLTAWLNGDL
jgi:hypothetical protein